MTEVRLPDGSTRSLAAGATAADLAAAIGPGLAKAAVAAKVNGEVVDLSRPLPEGADVALLTKRDAEALEVLRHSAAHLMADAILRVFPQGRSSRSGRSSRTASTTTSTCPKERSRPTTSREIEEEMARIARRGVALRALRVAEHDDADEHFARYRAIDGGHNKFKQEIVGDIKRARRRALASTSHGDFIDLCRGPHVPNTGWLKNVKLTKLGGLVLARRRQRASSSCACTARRSSTSRSSRTTCA